MPETNDADLISEVQKRYDEAQAHTSQWRGRARDDLRFFHADAYNHAQWDDAVYQARAGKFGGSPRPCLTINKTAQHVFQVENEARQSQMGVKVNATGFGSMSEAADALEGIIRHIEYQSNAQQNAYACAIQGQVRTGLGWVHIVTDYVPGVDTFDQDFFIKSVPNHMAVYFDPAAREPDHSDQNWAMIVEEMDRSEFDRQYPGHDDVSRDPLSGIESDSGWVSDNTVRVATYYRRSEKKDTLWMTPDGPMRQSDMTEEMVEIFRGMKAPSRAVTSHAVEKIIIAGNTIIAQGDTVFSMIPLVPFVGIETRATDGNDADYAGLVRFLIDPQRMFNYTASAFVESVALQTKAPWLAAAESIEGYEEQWAAANTSNAAYLPYNAVDHDTSQPLSPPTRIEPPTGSTGHLQGMQSADQWMQMVTGQYQAEMGAPGNEKSGVAIQQRQRQSDTANYHYTDNQGMALRYIGRLLIDAIPKVYDTQRAVQSLGMDGAQSSVVIDPTLQQSATVALPPGPDGQPQQPPQGMTLQKQRQLEGAILAINPTIGRYDVEADVGPAFATRRQDAFNALTQIVQADPQLMGQIGDLVFLSADFPLADEIADRLKPASDDPRLAQVQQLVQQLQGQIGQLQQQLKDKQADIQIKADAQQHAKVKDAMAADTNQYKAETDRMAAIGSTDPDALRVLVHQLVSEVLSGGPQQPPEDPEDGAAPAIQDGPPGPLPRLPSSNPPGGEIHAPNPVTGAVDV
ncbi:portal protein [Acetobacter orientalis]|uniref:portal protein n=1 Tax=Acetobacter orientalis TaxID=146474 RepID=UPI003868B99E